MDSNHLYFYISLGGKVDKVKEVFEDLKERFLDLHPAARIFAVFFVVVLIAAVFA